MRNHDQKTRDMARSILPSTARNMARFRKRASTRRARARNNERLNRAMAYLDDFDSFEGDMNSYDLDDTGTWGMVDDRREADKVAPLLRWAEARIARDRRLAEGDYWARRQSFAVLLGDTVIGRHALQHLNFLFGEANPYLYGRAYRTAWESRAQSNAKERAVREARARMLDDVLAGAGPRRLNTRIKALTPPVEPHWRYDIDGNRHPAPSTGCRPWLLDGDEAVWLDGAPRGRREAQDIAFEALVEVHVEMFGMSLDNQSQ